MKKIISVFCAVILIIGMVSVISVASAATPKLVAITFDDGPSGNTVTLLDGLKARGAKATFFCVADLAASRMSTLKRAVAEGHQIGNHTVSHAQLTKLSAAEIKNELNGCRKYLVEAGGDKTYCVRPPYGSHNATVRSVANAPLILWSVDTLDWKYRNADTVYNNIMRDTRDGSIILLHDLYSTSVSGALRAITDLQKQGYEFVTVNELFRRRGITMQNGVAYSCAYNKGITLPAAETPKKPTAALSSVWGGKSVTLTCATKDAKLYYTTDGTKPSTASKKYIAPLTLTANTKLRFAAYNGEWSEEGNLTVSVSKAPSPAASYQDKKLTLVSDATVYFTTDGSQPTVSSKVYSAPIVTTGTVYTLIRKKGYADRTMTYTPTKYGALLTDVTDKDWYYDAVSESIHRGIFIGVSDMEFAPNDFVTRAMFVTALSRLAGADTKGCQSHFTDVKKGKWYSGAIGWAEQTGIAKGISKTEFDPEGFVTREQMCVFLCRWFDTCQIVLPADIQGRKPFKDESDIFGWARESVVRLYACGIINGVGKRTFLPKNNATRAECAKLFVTVDDIQNFKK